MALALFALGFEAIAAPFVANEHALWVAFGFTVGGVLLASALAVVPPLLSVEFPPIRGGF